MDYVYLDEIAPDLDIDYARYFHCEQTIINPRLRELGYDIGTGTWHTGDGDSFGPLTRCIGARINRRSVMVVYG